MKRAKKAPVAATLLRLDLACGRNKQPGYLGVDRVALEGVDRVVDLEAYPWPWPDASVETVYCSHFIEHVSDFCAFMNELWRVMIPGGTATIIAPYYTSMRAWQDPTHKRAISEASFLYANKDWRTANGLDHYPITCDWDFSYAYALAPELTTRSQEYRDYAIKHLWNAVQDLHVTLTRR
jgi:predicted SAM-dependent methyltransferase